MAILKSRPLPYHNNMNMQVVTSLNNIHGHTGFITQLLELLGLFYRLNGCANILPLNFSSNHEYFPNTISFFHMVVLLKTDFTHEL